MQREYWDLVVASTVREAQRGRTPNPDILCNSRVKFGMFYDAVGKHFAKVSDRWKTAAKAIGGPLASTSPDKKIVRRTFKGRYSRTLSSLDWVSPEIGFSCSFVA
jgi:hypothetical protein